MSAADMSAALIGELRRNKDHICGFCEKHAEEFFLKKMAAF
jgi:hypothetical protein